MSRTTRWLLATWVVLLTAATPGLPSGASEDGPLSARRSAKVERRWGIEIVSLRSTGASEMLDFRYRVVDPQKALLFVDRTQAVHLVDQATGIALGVPSPSKLGPMRQTLRFGAPPAGRTLFMLFANPGEIVQSGDRVTLSVGELKLKNLRVQ